MPTGSRRLSRQILTSTPSNCRSAMRKRACCSNWSPLPCSATRSCATPKLPGTRHSWIRKMCAERVGARGCFRNQPGKTFGTGNPYGNGTTNRVGVTLSYTCSTAARPANRFPPRNIRNIGACEVSAGREQTIFDTTNVYLQILKVSQAGRTAPAKCRTTVHAGQQDG